MEIVRSYVDPITYVRFLHINGDQLDDDFQQMLLSADQATLTDMLAEREDELISVNTRVHETIHYWQGITYPYLYWYAFFSLQVASQVINELSKTTTDFLRWSAQVPGMLRFVEPQNLELVIENDPKRKGERFRVAITELEILESATSLLEWQTVERATPTDWKSYRRWTKLNPCYTQAYDLACKYVGDESLAIRFFVPLVRASFRTNKPIEAFCRLLGFMTSQQEAMLSFIQQSEPCRWSDLFDFILKSELELKDVKDFSMQVDQPLGLVDHFLGAIHVSNESATKVSHPFLSVDAKAFSQEIEREPSLAWILDQPSFAPDAAVKKLAREFNPPMTVYRVHFEGGGRTFHTLHPTDHRQFSDDIGHVMHSYMVMFGVLKRTLDMSLGPKLCHHKECPYFDSAFCNGYSIPPADWEKCKFPTFMKNTIDEIASFTPTNGVRNGSQGNVTNGRSTWQRLKNLFS